MDKEHVRFMEEALKEASKSFQKNEVPVGAIVVKDGRIIGRGHNRTEELKDVTSHAEINAIKDAENDLGGWRLNGCTMYVTTEPCTMCVGAIVLSRIEKLIIGAESPKSGACFTLKNLLSDARLNHTVEYLTGVMEDECSGILKKFFKKLRENKDN